MSFRPYKISSLTGRAVRTGIALLSRGIVAVALVLAAALPSHADTYELLQNGHFETGTLSGWHVANLLGSYAPGSFSIATNMNDPFLTPPSPSTPIAQLPSVGAAHGNYYAVSDSLGAGTHALLQNFTIPLGTLDVSLSFQMFVNDWNGAGALNANGSLDHDQHGINGDLIPTQFARVDLLIGSAGDFDTSSGVLATFYVGEDASTLPNPYTTYQFDLSPFVTSGSTYRLRFAEVDNQFTINQGVDDVSVLVHVDSVPEGSSFCLLLVGLAGLGATGHRMRRRSTANNGS